MEKRPLILYRKLLRRGTWWWGSFFKTKKTPLSSNSNSKKSTICFSIPSTSQPSISIDCSLTYIPSYTDNIETLNFSGQPWLLNNKRLRSNEITEDAVEFFFCLLETFHREEEVREKTTNSKEYSHERWDNHEFPPPTSKLAPLHIYYLYQST